MYINWHSFSWGGAGGWGGRGGGGGGGRNWARINVHS